MNPNIDALFDRIVAEQFTASKKELSAFARETASAMRRRAVANKDTVRSNAWYQVWFEEQDLSEIRPDMAVLLGVPLGGLVQFEVFFAGRTNHVEIASYRGSETTPAEDNEVLPATKAVFWPGNHAFFIEDQPRLPLTEFQLSACRILARMAIGSDYFSVPLKEY